MQSCDVNDILNIFFFLSKKSHYACNKKVSNNLKSNPKYSLRPIEYREQLLKMLTLSHVIFSIEAVPGKHTWSAWNYG